jgi:class 3 adenylate cyclase/predicted ATPase
MTFDEVLDQVRELVRQRGRVTYRSLKLRYQLDDELLAGITDELIKAERVAADENGEVLVWVGEHGAGSTEQRTKREGSPESSVQRPEPERVQSPKSQVQRQATASPATYTPLHLADRIRTATVTDGERKTITALFADLKGSTALIEGLDPEEARAIIDPALQLMMDAVHRYEGYVAQALGDGIFALFGAPIAHEDHPQRALYAALRMQEEMRRYSDQVRLKHGVPLGMRVGINTGEVVVRSIRKDDLHADYVPVGHSTNLAARMEQMAMPGSILVTAYTYKLTDGYFAFKALGQTQIKGVEEPLAVYEVLGAGPLRTRLQVSASRHGLTKFVGRQWEMEQLQSALEQAKAGHGQIVGVMGEPGLGKSRLFYEFKLLSQAGCLLLEAYSVSHGKASPYMPVIELLKGYFRIESQDDERTRREKVTGKALTLDRSLEDTLPYLFALLGIEEQPSPLQQMDPQIRRQRTFEALKNLFLRESLNQPLVLIFEDLHWIDSETQGFLDTLSEGIASAKILLLVNYRPEYRHEWGQKTYYTQLRLAPFGQAEAEEFLDSLLRDTGSPLPRGESMSYAPAKEDRVRVLNDNLTALKQLILAKTEGTPFFMEEVVQTLVEDGTLTGDRGHYTLTQSVTTLQLPTTVQGVLAARIDRLAPDEKALLQQLAVIGREFPLSLVKQVIAQPEDHLYRLLSSLQHKEFLYEQPAFPEVEYLFKHALTQEVAYNSVLIERRKILHEQTGHAIEQLYHDRLDEHYSELAHHYQRSGNTEKAVEYLQKSGQQAVQRSANEEAISYLTTAVELLATLPHTRARARQDLTLHITLGMLLLVSRSLASPDVPATYGRARELCQQLGETRELFRVLFGLRGFHLMRGEFFAAHELGVQLLGLAQQEQDIVSMAEAYWTLGQISFHLGKFSEAQVALEQSLSVCSSQSYHAEGFLGIAPEVFGLSIVAWVLWQLGYPEQALRKSMAAQTVAQERSHPRGLAAAWGLGSITRQFRRDKAQTQACAETAIMLSREHGMPVGIGTGTVLQGWALAEQGQHEEGIALISQGMAIYQAIGAGYYRSYQLALLAEAYGKAGQVEEGLFTLAEALTVIENTGERFYEAEVYRLKGELMLQQESKEQRAGGREQEAEACFLKAIEVAQKQQAKSLELRAVMSLVRLRQQQALKQSAKSQAVRGEQKGEATRDTQHATRAKLAEAYTMLSDVYTWFTEGFDTKDLQEAKALLEELQAS